MILSPRGRFGRHLHAVARPFLCARRLLPPGRVGAPAPSAMSATRTPQLAARPSRLDRWLGPAGGRANPPVDSARVRRHDRDSMTAATAALLRARLQAEGMQSPEDRQGLGGVVRRPRRQPGPYRQRHVWPASAARYPQPPPRRQPLGHATGTEDEQLGRRGCVLPPPVHDPMPRVPDRTVDEARPLDDHLHGDRLLGLQRAQPLRPRSGATPHGSGASVSGSRSPRQRCVQPGHQNGIVSSGHGGALPSIRCRSTVVRASASAASSATCIAWRSSTTSDALP